MDDSEYMYFVPKIFTFRDRTVFSSYFSVSNSEDKLHSVNERTMVDVISYSM